MLMRFFVCLQEDAILLQDPTEPSDSPPAESVQNDDGPQAPGEAFLPNRRDEEQRRSGHPGQLHMTIRAREMLMVDDLETESGGLGPIASSSQIGQYVGVGRHSVPLNGRVPSTESTVRQHSVSSNGYVTSSDIRRYGNLMRDQLYPISNFTGWRPRTSQSRTLRGNMSTLCPALRIPSEVLGFGMSSASRRRHLYNLAKSSSEPLERRIEAARLLNEIEPIVSVLQPNVPRPIRSQPRTFLHDLLEGRAPMSPYTDPPAIEPRNRILDRVSGVMYYNREEINPPVDTNPPSNMEEELQNDPNVAVNNSVPRVD